jgi:hypothetical protein
MTPFDQTLAVVYGNNNKYFSLLLAFKNLELSIEISYLKVKLCKIIYD